MEKRKEYSLYDLLEETEKELLFYYLIFIGCRTILKIKKSKVEEVPDERQ